MYRLFLALHYLLSRPINLLGVVGFALGVWALIVIVAIFSGYLVEVRNHLHEASADLTIRLPRAASFAEVDAIIDADPDVAAAAPRILYYALVNPDGREPPAAEIGAEPRFGADLNFVQLIGIDVAREAEVSAFGRWLDNVGDPGRRVRDLGAPFGGERPGIVVSEGRMEHGLRRGETVHLTTEKPSATTPEQELAALEFEVTGAFASNHAAFDNLNAYVDIDVLRRELLGTAADDVQEVAVRVRDRERAAEVAARLRRVLGERFSRVDVVTGEQINQQQLRNFEHQRNLMRVVLFVIMVVVALLMYATLSMMVTEKTHDIGILSAMGAGKLGVMAVFLSCGVAVTLAGVVIGVVTGCVSAMNLDAFNRWLKAAFDVDLFPTDTYFLRQVPYDLSPWWILLVAGVALAIGLVASGLPALRAAAHDPVESLRSEF